MVGGGLGRPGAQESGPDDGAVGPLGDDDDDIGGGRLVKRVRSWDSSPRHFGVDHLLAPSKAQGWAESARPGGRREADRDGPARRRGDPDLGEQGNLRHAPRSQTSRSLRTRGARDSPLNHGPTERSAGA
eukprot:CAMPEP_0197394502 /NCGR_PEP_ID=MMETSP1165-20131217/5334_1 /TAXON_ID=284809 /ORGANISM="Chrysocystis fragilis, Strain CCMP3189" /LENGTH=129 /DNA_ID=CAMNT_0042920217 /DNA_START=48 /DNA_END=434 /DNA_ORIENTATION=-